MTESNSTMVASVSDDMSSMFGRASLSGFPRARSVMEPFRYETCRSESSDVNVG
jgi:transposase